MKVTPTRWDLANLLLLQARRGAAPLMSITHPNKGAVANGLLQAELGQGGQQQWVTPLHILASHRAVLGSPSPPPPPLLIPDPTQPPTAVLTEKEARDLKLWCQLHLWGKRKESADRSGQSVRLQNTAGQKRKRVATRRFVEEDSDDEGAG